jgi:hypothetical protein
MAEESGNSLYNIPGFVTSIFADHHDQAGDFIGLIGSVGRGGRQARLRELSTDNKLGAAEKGWLNQEINAIDRGNRTSIRVPPGKQLAHERGREAAKGFDYRSANLQDRILHKLQHKYDNAGRANKIRPLDK